MPKFLEVLLTLGITFGIIFWLLWRSLKKSEDRLRTGSKIGLGAVVLGLWIFKVLPMASDGGGGAIVALIGTLPIMIILGILFAPHLGRWLASPLANLYDGGNRELVPRANYTIAEARIMQGNFNAAAAEIRGQLQKFPTDQRGWLMLAELQAAKFNDMDGAMQSLGMILSQVDAPVPLIAAAAHLAADLHLKHGHDPDSAREKLKELIERFPDSVQAQQAAERLGHLPTREQLEEKGRARSVNLTVGHRDLGLKHEVILPAEATIDERLMALQTQLGIHPGDSEAREKLVMLYVAELHDLDSARAQVNYAIAVPNITIKQQTRWLHLLAALEIRYGKNIEAAKRAMERIITTWPKSGYAEVAQDRIARLAMELKGAADAPDTIELGIYEHDLGLKKSMSPMAGESGAPVEAAPETLPQLAPAVLRTGELLAPKPQPEVKPAPKPLKRPSIKI